MAGGALAPIQTSTGSAGRSASLAHLLFSPLMRFLKFYVFRLGFLDGVAGLAHISVGCMNSYLKYAKLIELRRAEKDK